MTKRILIIVSVLHMIGAGLVGFRQLQKRTMVADIISDEADWDYCDSLAAEFWFKLRKSAKENLPA